MSIIHVEVGQVTELLPRNDAYALIFVNVFFFLAPWCNFGLAVTTPAAPAPTALPAQVPCLSSQIKYVLKHQNLQ